MEPCFNSPNRPGDDSGDLLVRQILFTEQYKDQSIIRAESSEGTFELTGQVIGIGALWRRTKKTEIDGKEIFSLVSRDFPTYPPETCPLCKKGIPLNQEFVKRREHRRPSHAQEHV